jgi:nicotinamidase/pyrazinamidase
VVDVQRDFCEGGALAAYDTRSLIEPLQKFIEAARRREELIVFTQDWHPPNHNSFKRNGGPWPVHCEARSLGAELMPPLIAHPGDVVIQKGVAPGADGYSAFEGTGLAESLHSYDAVSLAICGIATEYCVRATALDAAKAKFRAVLLTDLIRPVDSERSAAVLLELGNAGIERSSSQTWLDE